MSEIGYLTWFSVPEVAVPYDDLVALAVETDFPVAHVPEPPAPRHVWERATNLSSRGVKVDAPAGLAAEVREQYNTDPVIRVLTRVVCNSSPVLKRHLVREAVIPLANRTKKQLSLETVAVLTFDVSSSVAEAMPIPDEKGWVNGQIRDVLGQIDERMTHLLHHADAQDIRHGLRKHLETMHRVSLRNTGGVYFVPRSSPQSLERLYATRNFINSLGEWAVRDRPFCRVIVLDGENARELSPDISEAATAEYTQRLEELVESIQPVLAGRARGRVADRVNRNALTEWLQIRDGIGAYHEALQVPLEALNQLIEAVTSQVQTAVSRTFDVNLAEDETVRRIL